MTGETYKWRGSAGAARTVALEEVAAKFRVDAQHLRKVLDQEGGTFRALKPHLARHGKK